MMMMMMMMIMMMMMMMGEICVTNRAPTTGYEKKCRSITRVKKMKGESALCVCACAFDKEERSLYIYRKM